MANRSGSYQRKTKETDIKVSMTLASAAESHIDTGVPFFDHMLSAFSKHGMIALDLTCKGDLQIDDHHTVEDIGICMGKAFSEAISDKAGITRFGFGSVPMDDALCQVSVDLSGRPFFKCEGEKLSGLVGKYSGELTCEFLYAFVVNADLNLHVNILYGDNLHHIHEAVFKALGIALKQACAIDPARAGGIPSTKGTLS
jgi:imidazoleglycerol-phosphate dehydratase